MPQFVGAQTSGENSLSGITFSPCSSFLPTILEGQLCYKMDLKQFSGQGKEYELMLLLDYNEDRTLQTPSTVTDEIINLVSKNIRKHIVKKRINLDTAVVGLQDVSAKVQINTLSPYVRFGGGIFSMTLVKKMTAKSDFLQMPSEERNCDLEFYEDCRTRRLIEKCNCVTWELPGFEVKIYKYMK